MSPSRKQPVARVTLADVARLAGVSSAVVSYVINNGPRPVAPATAERVQHAIDVLEYRPNTHARALMTGTTGILGLIHPGTGNPFFGEYQDVMYQTASRAGIALLTASSAGRADTERDLIEDLARRDVDGILVVTSMVQSDLSSTPTTLDFPSSFSTAHSRSQDIAPSDQTPSAGHAALSATFSALTCTGGLPSSPDRAVETNRTTGSSDGAKLTGLTVGPRGRKFARGSR